MRPRATQTHAPHPVLAGLRAAGHAAVDRGDTVTALAIVAAIEQHGGVDGAADPELVLAGLLAAAHAALDREDGATVAAIMRAMEHHRARRDAPKVGGA